MGVQFAGIFQTYVIPILTFLGLGGGAVALFKVNSEKRKLSAEAGKTSAEADVMILNAHTDHSVKLFDVYERTVDKLQEDINALSQKMQREQEVMTQRIDRLNGYVEVLIYTMRQHDIPIPPMPPINKEQ